MVIMAIGKTKTGAKPFIGKGGTSEYRSEKAFGSLTDTAQHYCGKDLLERSHLGQRTPFVMTQFSSRPPMGFGGCAYSHQGRVGLRAGKFPSPMRITACAGNLYHQGLGLGR